MTKFPEGLLSWAGHRLGGVKRPFSDKAGRPINKIIVTSLVGRLRNWTSELAKGETVPKLILLVGGPGNGKTDAFEDLACSLDENIQASGKLVGALKHEFHANGVLPRKVTINIEHLIQGSGSSCQARTFSIVQDASVGDPLRGGKSPEHLLVEDLAACLDDQENIFIAGINRGILAEALNVACKDSRMTRVASLLRSVAEAIAQGAKQLSCWPLDNYPEVAAWPMDVESLVDPRIYDKGLTPAHQIFREALDQSRWVSEEDCPAGDHCPFHWNRKMLSCEKTLESLIHILRFYELASGKRWTFRELFSLVPQLLVGHDNDFITDDGRILSPCDWAAEQLHLIDAGVPVKKSYHARFLLISRLYYNSMFPIWPQLSDVKEKCKKVLQKVSRADSSPSDFFEYLAWQNNKGQTSIKQILAGPFSNYLDPVLASAGTFIGDSGLTMGSVEEAFCFSVMQGHELVKTLLNPIELLLLGWLCLVEKSLEEPYITKDLSSQAENARATIKMYACRLVKRSLGTRYAAINNIQKLSEYEQTIYNGTTLNKVRQEFQKILNHGDKFLIPLMSTFGQPVPSHNATCVLQTDKVKVEAISMKDTCGTPRILIPFFNACGYTIPLTFSLYKSLQDVARGLNTASLPAEILTLLEGVRAKLGGIIVHDNKELEDSILSVGDSGEVLIVEMGTLHKREVGL